MKQTLLSLVMMVAAISLSAQDLQYKLVRYSDNSNHEMVEFIYNDQHVLVAVHTIEYGSEGYEVYDSLKYDNNGNLIKMCGWQRFADTLRFVNYIDYGYDAQNRIVSRTNYNLIGGNFELGGVFDYTYDDNGLLSLAQLTMGGSLFQEIVYTNENDKRISEVWKLANYNTVMEEKEKLTYEYDSLGRLVTMNDSLYEEGEYTPYLIHEYQYDSVSNCKSHRCWNSTGDETERSIYSYIDKKKSETLMPWTPEMTRPENTTYNTNVYDKEEYWTLDVNFVLQHICDYTYEYVGINESNVDNVVIDQMMSVKKVLINGQLYIECGDKMYDLNGRRIK